MKMTSTRQENILSGFFYFSPTLIYAILKILFSVGIGRIVGTEVN